MKKNIQWLFFDIGSTLVDETLCYEDRYRRITAGTSVSYEEFHEKVIYYSRLNCKGDHRAAQEYGLTLPKWNSDLESLYPNVSLVLDALKSKGYKLGIIANQAPGTKERLERYGILHFFDEVVASAEEGISKPDQRIFEIALQRANCLPGEAVMIGDRLDNDILPAKALGMKTVWVKQGPGRYYQIRSEEERPDEIIDALDTLPTILDRR